MNKWQYINRIKKKMYTILAFQSSILFFLSANHLFAQDTTASILPPEIKAKKNAITISPLPLIAPLILESGFMLDLQYEHKLKKKTSFNIGLNYGTPYISKTESGGNGNLLAEIRYTGLSITPEFRYYFNKKKESLRGWFFSAFYRHSFFKEKYYEPVDNSDRELIYSDNIQVIGLGGKIGAKIGRRFIFEPTIALGYGFAKGFDESRTLHYSISRMAKDAAIYGIELKIGWMF